MLELHYDYIIVTSDQYYEEIQNELTQNYGIPSEKIILLNTWIYEFKNAHYYCNLCSKNVPMMLRIGLESPAFQVRKIVGGGVRYAKCPICNSYDRNRWVQYVLEHRTDIYKKTARILHFAPEAMIEAKLRVAHHEGYITADINEKKRVDQMEDITDITFPDRTFDYIICNHIMEHITEEGKAFSELKRCLKKDGKVIFSVPICWEEGTIEDDTINTEEKRLLEYGQKDHVRLYGNDLKMRLEKYDFKVTMYRVDQELSEEEIRCMRLIKEDTVWVLERKD